MVSGKEKAPEDESRGARDVRKSPPMSVECGDDRQNDEADEGTDRCGVQGVVGNEAHEGTEGDEGHQIPWVLAHGFTSKHGQALATLGKSRWP